MVDWNKLIETGGSIKVELSAADLNNLANETGRKSAQELYDLLQKEESGEYITGDNVCKLLKVSRTTLWNWDKKGITKPRRLGNIKRYLKSEIIGLNRDPKEGKV